MGRDSLIANKAVPFAITNTVKGLPRMAALLWVDGQMFVGLNSRKTHPLAKKFSKNDKTICLHAEIDAIRKCISCGIDPSGGVMAVARVLKNNTPALAKPCAGCASAIVAFGIRNVEWTTDST